MQLRLKIFLGSALASALLLGASLLFLRFLPSGEGRWALTVLLILALALIVLSGILAFWLWQGKDRAASGQLQRELEEKAEALEQLRQLKTLLVAANDRLSRRLFENQVMLAIWSEQDRALDTKEFLSRLLEALLPGLPFEYGCVIIRPLAAIGPEMIFARVERNHTRSFDLPLDDEMLQQERTLWISDIDPRVKEFLLASGQESKSGEVLSLEKTHGSLDATSPPKEISVLTLALRQGNDYLGSLHLLTDQETPRIGSSLQNFLTNVRSQVAVLLQIRALSYAMRVDPLTRLYNRGYMHDRLREEILRSSRTGRPFTFLLLDVDHFKQVNDTYGHQAGDEVLVGLASLLRKNCRASDAICRYGGEEIAIILVDTPLEGAKTFAENIRSSIEEEAFPHEGGSLKVTVSMGLAEFPSHSERGDALIAKADQALYAAKKAGRNNWKCAQI